MAEWKREVESRGFKDHPSVPYGPPPKGISSMRALPEVHDALRQNDPSKLKHHSRAFQRKPLQQQAGVGQQLSIQEMNLQGLVLQLRSLHRHQGQRLHGMFKLKDPPAAAPVTPGHPPRPPIEALPQPIPEVAIQATHKHPRPQPAQEGPPNKQVRHKAFPHDQQAPSTMSMASSSAVDMSRMSAPSPKGPPASFMPTPGDVQRTSSCAAAADPENRCERGRIYTVRSASDIDWNHLLEEQLES